jgi:hypothetical protein
MQRGFFVKNTPLYALHKINKKPPLTYLPNFQAYRHNPALHPSEKTAHPTPEQCFSTLQLTLQKNPNLDLQLHRFLPRLKNQ